jgi:large subunit ribosomal protein L21
MVDENVISLTNFYVSKKKEVFAERTERVHGLMLFSKTGIAHFAHLGLTGSQSNGLMACYCSGGLHMYAIVQTGGKQYKVQSGDHLKVEKIVGDPGSEVTLDQVLAIGSADTISLGKPLVADAAVKATIMRTAKDRKILVFKKKRRHGFKKKQGHRQWYTLLKIGDIVTGTAMEATS